MKLASSFLDIRRCHYAFASLLAISVALFWTPLRTIAALAWSDDRYSHLLLIPVISAFLLYFERGRIFSQPSDRRGAGFLFLAEPPAFTPFPLLARSERAIAGRA